MRARSLNCPSCGAPLRFGEQQNRALCLYCGSTVLLETGRATSQSTFELPPEVLDQLKQMILDGRKLEAIHLYQQRAGVTQAEAIETLNQVIADLTRRTLVEQPMSNRGLATYIAIDTILTLFVVWGFWTENWIVFGVALAVMLLHSFAFAAGLRARLLLQFGEPAAALVRRVVRLGEIKLRGEPEPVPIARLWLEVRPSGRPPFQSEKNVAIRSPSLAQVRPGTLIEVRCNAAGQVAPVAPLKVLPPVRDVAGEA